MIRVKHVARLQDAEGDMNELTHGGADDFHFGFAAQRQALTELAHDWVVLFSDDCWHIQGFANSGVTGL